MSGKLDKLIKILLSALLFLLPWQTIYITKENFLNGEKWQSGTLGFYATEGLLWLCAVLFIIWFYKKNKLRFTDYGLRITKQRIFILSLLLFTVYTLLSTVWAINSDLAFQHGRRIMEAAILFLIILSGPLNFRQAALWFVAGAILPSVLGIYQFFAQSTFAASWLGLSPYPVWQAGSSVISTLDWGRWLRASGPFPHPNIFGGYLVASLIFTFFLLAKEKKQTLLRVTIYGLLITTQLTALFATFSRSAWLAFGVFIITYIIYNLSFIKKPNNKNYELRITSYGLLIMTILSIIFFPIVQTRFSQETVNEIISTDERLDGYSEAGKIFKQNIFFGVGAGNYTAAAYRLNPNLPGWTYQPVHNVPLLILTELGIIGSALLIGVFISFIRLIPRHFYIIYGLLLLFDHYLFSGYTGLMLSAVFLSGLFRISADNA